MRQLQFATPLGPLVVTTNLKGIESVLFRDNSEAPDHSNDLLLLDCKAQFDAYFKGTLQQFDLPL
ncbi:MAG: cysteine methyltransferase, partial [Pararheinheimera sp.]|nr:cysteine methyltransferase [Rheinheimera sp.]